MYKACRSSTTTKGEKAQVKITIVIIRRMKKGNMLHFIWEPEGNTKYMVTEQLTLHKKQHTPKDPIPLVHWSHWHHCITSKLQEDMNKKEREIEI